MPDQPPTTNHHPPFRIIFMGTPEFAVPALDAILSCGAQSASAGSRAIFVDPVQPDGSQNWQIVAVYTQPPRPAGRGQQLKKSAVHELAEQHNIPVFTPTSLKTPEAQAEFRALNADVAVVVAYGLLLPQVILDTPKHGCINIHPSALPRWRGAAPIQRTIMAGDTATEICIMKMDAGLDTGAVYKRSASISILPSMNAGELNDKLARDAAPLLLEVLHDIANGVAVATPQSEIEVTYAHKISKEECGIDWTKSAQEILNHIRGLSPFMGATIILKGEVIKVYKAEIARSAIVGALIGMTLDDQLTIACGNGTALKLLEVQKAGKPRMSTDAFLRGQSVAKGTQLS